MSFYKKHKRGIVGTIIYHIIILLILIFLGFFTPLPLPGEEGILVDFGTSDQGLGAVEPSPQRRNPEPVQPVRQEQQRETTPPPQSTPPPSEPETQPAEEVAMTQDFEETVAIDAAEQRRREEEERQRQQRIEEERRRQQALDEERRRQEELERQRQEELEQQRLAELERQRQEEAERQRIAEEQRRVEEINSRAQGAFSQSGSGSGGEGNNSGQSEGVTFPGGNQGVPTGGNNPGNYGEGGSGSGNQGSGPSYSLTGRTATSLPKPRYPGNDEGLVVVNVTVDKYGNVTAAEPGARGTTIANPQFWTEAREAALKAKFNVDESAPSFQQGTITYRFVLD